MTRHPRLNYYFTSPTKETRVKLTAHIAKPTVASKIGRFALLRGPRHALWSGAPASGPIAAPFVARSLVVLCALVGLFALALTPALARAEAPRLINVGGFDPGPIGLGVAVDGSTGDVYVAALLLDAKIQKFDSSGSLIAPPSPFGAGSDDFSGAAVNPTNGQLYVIDAGQSELDTYDSATGALLSSFAVPSSANNAFGLDEIQIATDTAGNVYVPVVPENKVIEYSPAGTLLREFTGGAGADALNGPTGVAVDSAGNVWVADGNNNRIEELDPTGTPIRQLASAGVTSLALDGQGDVFAIVNNSEDFCGSLNPPCPHLLEYTPGGARVADVGAGSFEGGSAEPFHLTPMLAVNSTGSRVYVTDPKTEKVWIFGPPTAPEIAKELAVEVTASEAKLGATINPGGIQTTYRFEYGTTTAYGHSTPVPEGSAGEGLSLRTLYGSANALAPGATYHYRVVAVNELGTVTGPDETFATLSAEAAACPNEQFRTGFSARLPDCRAYELVTPPTKTSMQIAKIPSSPSADGNATPFSTFDPLPGAPTGSYNYVATRGPAGWVSEDIMPLESYSGAICAGFGNGLISYSDVTSRALIHFGAEARADDPKGEQLGKQECNVQGLQAAPGEPLGYESLLVRDGATGEYRLVNAVEAGVASAPEDPDFDGASADLSDIVFTEKAPLTSLAPPGTVNLYESRDGAVRLAGVLPDGTPTVASVPEVGETANVVTAQDGGVSDVVFTAVGRLYVRVNGERTVALDETQGPGAGGGGTFQVASSDGSTFLFTDTSRLTADSTAQAGEPDLYQCVLPPKATKCGLRDLTVAEPGEHADVIAVSAFGSRDSSHVYFVAGGVLATNKREHKDAEGHTVVEQAQAGQRNLYLWSAGTTTFIAHDSENEGVRLGRGIASPDGSWFAFNSTRSLTGYDNRPTDGGFPVGEIYVFDAATDELECASCKPDGAPPPKRGLGLEQEVLAEGGSNTGGASVDLEGESRQVSNGGRVFFLSAEALLPSDTNGETDVYEYHGALSLITSGTASSHVRLVGASESGSDVFFTSQQALVPQDTQPGALLLYDARVAGGLLSEPSFAPCTTADACRAPVSPQPSVFGAPSSQTFEGAGNVATPGAKPKAELKAKPVKCKKGLVKNKKDKCVRKKSKKQAKRASHDRRGK